jgi:hypothetical protein
MLGACLSAACYQPSGRGSGKSFIEDGTDKENNGPNKQQEGKAQQQCQPIKIVTKLFLDD